MKNKIILPFLVFAASAFAGFVLASFIDRADEKTRADDELLQEAEPETTAPFIHDITSPSYNSASQKYSFTVTASENTETYCLADASGKHIPGYDRKDGSFTVPAVAGGKYHVFVKDAQGNASDQVMVQGCNVQITPVTAEELEKLLMSKNVDAADKALRGRTAGTVSYVFTNLSADELEDKANVPKHYMSIIDRLKLGMWGAVKVNSVSVNGAGQLSKAVITITY